MDLYSLLMKKHNSQRGFMSLFVMFAVFLILMTGLVIYFGDTSEDIRDDSDLQVSITGTELSSADICFQLGGQGCTFSVDLAETPLGIAGENGCTGSKPFCVQCASGSGWDGKNCTPSGGAENGCVFGYGWNGDTCVSVHLLPHDSDGEERE
jgi:hypothetical protein